MRGRPGRTPRPPPSGSPHKGAEGNGTLTGQSGLRAPASGRAGWLAGGYARASVRVSACVPVSVCASVYVCDGGRAELCASACAGASIRRSVRPTLRPLLRARSFAGPPHQMHPSCGVAGAAAGWVRHPQPSPGSAPPPGGLAALPRIAQG